MTIFPIFKWDDRKDEQVDEVIGYQVLSNDGTVLAKGETPEEASEAALVAIYLAESNSLKKVKLGRKLISRSKAKVS